MSSGPSGQRASDEQHPAADRDDLLTAIRELEQTADAFRALAENTSDPLMVLDLDGRVREWNLASELLFGWSAQEALGQVMPHVAKDKQAGALTCLRDIAAMGEIQDSERPAVRKDGSTVMLELTCVPLTDGDGLPVGILCLSRRVTADSRLEQLQDRFVSLVSQELKNPLTTIMGYTQLLGRPEIAEDATKRSRTVRALEARVRSMASLVDDLLLASRIAEGQLELQLRPTDLAGTITDTVTRFERFDTQHRFVLDVDTGIPPTLVDPRRVEQALTNVLSNAARYSPESGEICISLARDGDDAVLSVTDQGPGIEPEYVAHVFERFSRAEGDASTGAGLGLYLVKMIAEAHGGGVGVDSKQGSGSTFSLWLPLRVPHGSVADADPAGSEGHDHDGL